MVVVEPLDLYAIRKNQRRVAALLSSDKADEVLRYPLRRKSLPSGYCYVCSRLDPAGVFHHKNSYLFQRGFFSKCEHLPQAPYPTFIGEDIAEEDEHEDVGESPDHDTSISVKIGKKSQNIESYGKEYYEIVDLQGNVDASQNTDEKRVFRLPPVFSTAKSGPSSTHSSDAGRLVPITSEKTFKQADRRRRHETEEELIERLNRVAALSEQGTFQTSYSMDMNNQEEGKDRYEATFSNQPYDLSDQGGLSGAHALSRPGAGRGRSRKPMYFEPDFLPMKGGGSSPRLRNGTNSNYDDAGVSYAPKPIINDIDGPDGSPKQRISPRHRPRAGRHRQRQGGGTDDWDDESSSSGHIKYHHRSTDDDVPSQGFVVPKTPSESEWRAMAEEERLEKERKARENLISVGDHTSVGDSLQSTDIGSEMFSDTASMMIQRLSGNYCECHIEERIVVRDDQSIEMCKGCGKPIRKGGMERHIIRTSSFRSRESRSRGGRTISREKMYRDGERSREKGMKSKTGTDEDYMDMDKLINDNEDYDYWMSENEGVTLSTCSSVRRLKEAKPWPTVDPNIHKNVYLRALEEVHSRKLQRMNVEETRPNRPVVFSYFKLWPFAGRCNNCGNVIGIKPPKEEGPDKKKSKNLMKHIFGEVKVEDYYPGGKKNPTFNSKGEMTQVSVKKGKKGVQYGKMMPAKA